MRKVLFILGQLDDADLHWMRGVGAVQNVPDGQAIVEQGRPLDRLYIVLDGEFTVRIREQGDRVIARLGTGEVVGEMSMLDSRPPNATVAAAGPSRVFAIPHSALLPKLASDHRFAAHYYRAIAIFLANRLNRAVALAGTSGDVTLSEDEQELDEISPDLMETMSLAGARFRTFLEQIANK